MASLPPSILETLMKQISQMPLWIRQVIYAQLKQDLEHSMSSATLEAFTPQHMLQLWVPELTREGIHMLTTQSHQRNTPLVRLLHLARYQKNVGNITVLNAWSMEQCSLYLKEAIEQKLLVRSSSGIVLATIEYLANTIRLGEYLVKINRITAEQLDQALRTQKYIEESMGERTGIANVMINLGYIKKEDTEGILFLKEESKKPFQMINFGTPDAISPGSASVSPSPTGQNPLNQGTGIPRSSFPQGVNNQTLTSGSPLATPMQSNQAAFPPQANQQPSPKGLQESTFPTEHSAEKSPKKWGLF